MATDRLVTQKLSDQYLDALIRRDSSSAINTIEDSVKHGLSTVHILVDIVGTAQVKIGEMWHAGEINVAQEHLATQITLDVMDRLRQKYNPHSKWGVRAVITCVEGNFHYIGAKMVADLLTIDGWDVEFLGANTPSNDLVEFVRQSHPHLVGLSVALETDLEAASQAVSQLRRLPDSPKILIGGQLTGHGSQQLSDLGSDSISPDAIIAIQEARRLAGLTKDRLSLDEYLTVMGSKVQDLRKGRSWNQEQLAQASNLDRTYISAVENGKQNLTIGVVLKLADALEVPLGQLLSQ